MLFLQMLKVSALCAMTAHGGTGATEVRTGPGASDHDSDQIRFYKFSPKVFMRSKWQLRFFSEGNLLGRPERAPLPPGTILRFHQANPDCDGSVDPVVKFRGASPSQMVNRAPGFFRYSEKKKSQGKTYFEPQKENIDLSECYIISNDETRALSGLSHDFTQNKKGDAQMMSCAIVQRLGQRNDDNSGKPERPFLLKMHEYDIKSLRDHALNREPGCTNFFSKGCGPTYTGTGGVIVFRKNGQNMFRYYNNENVLEDFGKDVGGVQVETETVPSRYGDKRDAIIFDFSSEDGPIGTIALLGAINDRSDDKRKPAGKLYHLLREAGLVKSSLR